MQSFPGGWPSVGFQEKRPSQQGGVVGGCHQGLRGALGNPQKANPKWSRRPWLEIHVEAPIRRLPQPMQSWGRMLDRRRHSTTVQQWMQLRRWMNPQGMGRWIPAGSTGDKMSPGTQTPGVSEPLLPAGRLSGSSLAEGLSSRPQRPILCPPRYTGCLVTSLQAHPPAVPPVQEAEAGWPRGSMPLRRAPVGE